MLFSFSCRSKNVSCSFLADRFGKRYGQGAASEMVFLQGNGLMLCHLQPFDRRVPASRAPSEVARRVVASAPRPAAAPPPRFQHHGQRQRNPAPRRAASFQHHGQRQRQRRRAGGRIHRAAPGAAGRTWRDVTWQGTTGRRLFTVCPLKR